MCNCATLDYRRGTFDHVAGLNIYIHHRLGCSSGNGTFPLTVPPGELLCILMVFLLAWFLVLLPVVTSIAAVVVNVVIPIPQLSAPHVQTVDASPGNQPVGFSWAISKIMVADKAGYSPHFCSHMG
jgi:hypothetical protein